MDGSIHGTSMGGMELYVATMASDLGRADDTGRGLWLLWAAPSWSLSDEADCGGTPPNAAKRSQ
ncbi:MAG: hypothetical protein ACLTHL_06475 [Collinsella sp.]